MTEPQLSGADLAMQALRQARAAAKAQPPSRVKRRPQVRRADRGSGRDPNVVSDVLEQLAVAYNWRRPSAAGQIMARWKQVAPEGLAALASPDKYDPDTRTLYLAAVSYPAAAKLRGTAPQIAAALNEKVGADTVAVIKVLQPGAARRIYIEPVPPEPAAATEAPIKTRGDASPGYRAALAAHQAHVADRAETDVQQRARAAAERQTAAMRAHREDTDGHTEAVWFVDNLEETAAADRETTRQVAIRRARDERAGRAPALPTVFQRTA
ncbi:DciA family protein [Streptomyces tubercidicus]|uniref:DciA family protein n=1 Tax=Streptomyces tubercidicus TaxID=47759 RepID=UPI003466B9C8